MLFGWGQKAKKEIENDRRRASVSFIANYAQSVRYKYQQFLKGNKMKRFIPVILPALVWLFVTETLQAEDMLYFTSAPGSWIGQGQTLTFTSPTTTFSVYRYFDQGAYTNSVHLSAGGYGLALVGPDYTLPTVGMYTGAVRWPFMGTGAGLCFTAPGRCNNTLTGYFNVLQADYDISGNIVSFAVDFMQYDEGVTANWVSGSFRFNSTISEGEPPVTDAGPNQVAYAWIDGIAEVDLDGSGSYDPDGNELTYLWRWSIDGNNYEANGVTPTIELPVGQHTVELVVNDGSEDSEPNYVDINVIEPIEGTLWITPRVINRRGEQPRIMAMLRLPEGITKDQIDSNSALLFYPGEAESYRQMIFGDGSVRILAYFDRDEILDSISEMGPVEVYVVGQLKTGQYFYGSDTIRIIHQAHR